MKNSGALLMAVMLAGPSAPALQAGAGTEAAPFLKIDAGARAAALGGAFSAAADDASSVFYNPAGPGLMAGGEMMLSHNQWIAGLKNEHFAYVRPQTERLTLFTGLNLLISPAMDRYDAAGAGAGSFSAVDGALGAGVSWAFAPDFCGGLAAKAVYQQADKEKAYAYAGDAGFVKKYDNLAFGLAVQNLGTPLKLYKESFALPATFRAGAAWRPGEKIRFSADVLKSGRVAPAFAAGAEGELEVTPVESVFARLGYKSGASKNAGSGISAGVGLRSRGLRFDYAFAPLGDLGAAHRLTVIFKFGVAREDLGLKKELPRLRSKRQAAPQAEPVPSAGDKDKKKEPSQKDKRIEFTW